MIQKDPIHPFPIFPVKRKMTANFNNCGTKILEMMFHIKDYHRASSIGAQTCDCWHSQPYSLLVVALYVAAISQVPDARSGVRVPVPRRDVPVPLPGVRCHAHDPVQRVAVQSEPQHSVSHDLRQACPGYARLGRRDARLLAAHLAGNCNDQPYS